MTPQTHTRVYRALDIAVTILSFLVLVGIGLALAGVNVFARRGWFDLVHSLIEKYSFIGVAVGLIVAMAVLRFLMLFIWGRIRPACERCSSSMRVVDKKPITYECSGCTNRIRTKASLASPGGSGDIGSSIDCGMD